MVEWLLMAQLALREVRVLDADTLRTRGVDYRLAEIDAPEIGGRARCDAERAAGEAAKARVQALLAGAAVVTATPARDPPGRRVWPRDGFGRRQAFITIDGVDLGALLVAEGHARPRRRGQAPIDWCAGGG